MSVDDFDSFVRSVVSCLKTERSERGRVLAIRVVLAEALRLDSFVLDCIERITLQIDKAPGAWHNSPLHSDPELDYSIRLIYWPPRYANNPHQHNSWTVTGVFHNQIKVNIYRLDHETVKPTPIEEKNFMCGKSEVGYILSPCIHSITNPTNATSVSLHVFSALAANAGQGDGVEEDSQKKTIWYPSPRKGEVVKGITQRALGAHIEILKQIRSAKSLELLDKVFELGDRQIKLASVKAMCCFDIEHAAQRLSEFARISPEPARSDLQKLSHRLLKKP